MDARTLKKLADEYERETGMDPVQFKACEGTTKEKHAALWADVNWYRVHTESIAHRLGRLVQSPA